MSSFIKTLVVIIFLFGIVTFTTLNKPEKPMVQKKIVAFGDSLVYGTGSTDGNDFVSQLSVMIGMPIINLGVPGNTTAQGLRRIDEVLEEKPDVVILLLGGNDALQNVNQRITFENLGTIINILKTNGIEVLLLGVHGKAIFSDPYSEPFRNLAKDKNVGYVPDVLAGLLGNKSLMSDGVHPNDIGYEKIANKVFPHLNRLLK